MKGPERYFVDTNVLVRFLTGEPIAQANAARKIFSRAEAGELTLEILPLIVAEAYYVLVTLYQVERKIAAERLLFLIQKRGLHLRESTKILSALQLLQSTNVDFADAYVAATAIEENVGVVSFDKDFNKFRDVRRYETAD